ncbi:MAG: DUF2235 domain-containing protein [Hyphomonadaceae bacterium]
MKRFVVCFDGTWQKLRQPKPTNIAIIARSVAHTHTLEDGSKIPQIVIYSQGVGSNVDALGKDGFMDGFSEWLNQMLGGVFGEGLEDVIVETYLRLAFNYEEGDEIYIFGFSRGAFCARSFAGLIGSAGIVSRMHAEKAWDAFRLYRAHPGPKATKFELEDYERARRDFRASYGKGKRAADGTRVKSEEPPKVTYLGIFETVGQRGVPSVLGGMARFFNKRFGFHDMTIGTSVLAARHAVAVDENRLGFPPTLWEGVDEANKRPHCEAGRQHYAQRWFIGTHGDVGGGEGSALSAAPLKWVAEGAAECGLRFYGTYGEDESPLAQAVREAGLIFDARISRPRFWDSLSPMNYPIYTRSIWKAKTRKDAPTMDYAASILDETVRKRMEDMNLKPPYNPGPLRVFRSILIPPPPKPLKGKKAKRAAAQAEATESATLETPLVDAQIQENRAE